MGKPLSLYLVFTCFNPDIVSYFSLILHACTDLKYIFLDLLCRKGIPLTNKNPWLVLHCGSVCLLEGERVSLGWSCGDLVSFWFSCLVWWVFGEYICILLFWCRLL